MRFALLISLACLVGQSSIEAQAMAASAATAKPAEVIPLYSSQYRNLMMLRVAGKGPFPVVFDTGTEDNVLDKAIADSLGLPRVGPSTLIDGTTGKPVPGYQTRLDDATISGVPVRGILASVMDRSGRDDAGVFGPNSFSGRLVKLDFGHHTLTLIDKLPATMPKGQPVPYSKGGDGSYLPSINVTIGKMSFNAVADVGNTDGLLFPMSWAKKLPLEHPPIADGQAVSAGGIQTSYSAKLRGQVRIGCLILTNPQVEFLDGGEGDGGGNVGLQILQQLSIVLDPAEKRSWFEGCPGKAVKRTARSG